MVDARPVFPYIDANSSQMIISPFFRALSRLSNCGVLIAATVPGFSGSKLQRGEGEEKAISKWPALRGG